jgi:glyoxylase-like metal-dependent hydrolase (beta-lactamase superfamily II)
MRQMGTHRWTVGAVDVIRVADPGFELVLPQDPDTASLLAASAWLHPQFVTAEQALRVGSSAIAVRTPSATILIDPFLAFDDPARLAPRLAALRAAGVEPDDVDIVVNTHIDGIGANVLADGSPAFGAARYLIPAAEIEEAAGGLRGDPGIALVALHKEGRAEAMIGGETLVPGVRLEDAPGHSQGHVVVWVESGGSQAVVTGHLFLHPAQLANPEVDNGDVDPPTLFRTRRTLLARCVRDDATLIGPLFAPPGGGKVRQDGTGWRLQLSPTR